MPRGVGDAGAAAGTSRPARVSSDARPSSDAGPSNDAGSSTVPAVGIAAVAVALALMVGVIAQGMSARVRADTAADLAALAVVQAAGTDACEVAQEVARRNGATDAECISRPDLGRSSVTVEVPLGISIAGLGDDLTVKGSAVAGRAE